MTIALHEPETIQFEQVDVVEEPVDIGAPYPASLRDQPATRKHLRNPLTRPPATRTVPGRAEAVDALVRHGIVASRVLELGCSIGQTAVALRRALAIDYYAGVESAVDEAMTAMRHMDAVHQVADLEPLTPAELGIAENDFDLLVALDVLGRLHNPWDALVQWVSVIRPGGHALLSLPNIQNIGAITGLVNGHWPYEGRGGGDVRQLRHFTQAGVLELLTGAGLNVLAAEVVVPPDTRLDNLRATGNSLSIGQLNLSNLSKEQMIGLLASQYIVIARKNG